MPASPGDSEHEINLERPHQVPSGSNTGSHFYNAIETSEKIEFNQLHRDDYGPIGYDKRCKKCGQVVTNDQITKGYQYEPDLIRDRRAGRRRQSEEKTTKAVDIIGFVDSSEIPTTFYDSPYYAGPDGPVLREACTPCCAK